MIEPRLSQILRPSSTPTRVDLDEEVSHARSSLGTELPPDYLELIRVYGRGEIDGTLGVFTPREVADGVTYLAGLYAELAALTPGYADQSLFPTSGGLLWWACGPDRERWHWKTVGEPHEWPVVVEDPDQRPASWTTYELTCTAYLDAMLRGELPDAISSSFSRGAHEWRPLPDPTSRDHA
jgi:hypothetical protein